MAMLLLLPMDTMEDMLQDNHTTFMSIIIQNQHLHRHQHLHQLWNQLQKEEKQQQRKIVIKI